MISALLHFEDVFGSRNQGGIGGRVYVRGSTPVGLHSMCEEGKLEGGCGNAATARGSLDTACEHSSVI